MSEDENRETSKSNDQDEDNDGETIIQAFKKSVDKLALEENRSTTASGVVFQQLLCKFQQMQTNEADHRDRFHQEIALCNELIDNVEKATFADVNDFQNCLELFCETLPDPEFNVLEEDEKLFAHEIFFALLDSLSKPQICTYLNDNQHITTLQKLFYDCLTNLFLDLVTDRTTLVPITNDDIATRKYTDIFCAMRKRVEHDLQLSTQIEQPVIHVNQTTVLILSLLWNLSDRTVLVPWLLGTSLVKTILECLKITDISSKIAHQAINIIHNISRHDDGADELNKFHGLVILKDIQSSNGENSDDYDSLTTSMAIAQLSTVEQIRSDNKRMNRILNRLLQATIDAAKAEDHRNKKRMHVSEPLAVFTKLFVDDHSLEYVLNHAETDPQFTVSSTIALFIDLLIAFRGAFAVDNQLKQFTCTALLNILWSISFQDRYKTKLKQSKKLLKTIKSLAMDAGDNVVDQYVPRSMENMSKAANGILHNLNEVSEGKESVIADTQFVSNASGEKPIVMISYAHDNNPFCDKILAEFEKNRNQFGIWIDRDHCSSSEDLWEKIARGIRQSNLVVCLLSQEYFNSKSCRKEMEFVIRREKRIVPIYIGEPGDCDWLDIHIAALKYVRFKGDTTELDRGKVQELLKTIEATIKETQATIKETQIQPLQKQTEQPMIRTRPRKAPEIIKSTTFETKKSPEEWTVDDIQKWFSNHKVPDTLVKLFDFQSITEMHQYASKLHADSKNEFLKYRQRYAKNYAGEELEEYIFDRFKNALFKLPESQLKTVNASMSSSQISTPKSSTCTIL